jgi:hypothetical protein
MSHHTIARVIALFCAVAWSASASAQTPAGTASARNDERSAAGAPAPLAEGRRAIAISIITSLADEARDYKDETLRVRIQARAADALWEIDRERSVVLFRRAWEAAEAVDKAGARLAEEERLATLSAPGRVSLIPPPPNLRAEVLRQAARRDRKLAEEFLAEFDEGRGRGADAAPGASLPDYWDPTEPPAVITKRLELAGLLLEGGDLERALMFADPALQRATKPGVVFLSTLRQNNAAVADRLFAALLARTADDPLADANTVSLISSYAFTPFVFVTVTRAGRAFGGDPAPAPDLSPELRAAFFRTAAHVLLRPSPPPDQDRTSAGRAGTYLVITRLLPLFERHAPARVPELRARLASLTADVSDRLRADGDEMLTVGLTPAPPTADESESTADKLRRASTAAERDRIYLAALSRAITSDDPQARELADRIENPDLRKRARAFLDFAALRNAIKKTNTEEALRLARTSEFTHAQRVWAYTETARLVGKSNPALVVELLEEAAAAARRIEDDRSERARALTAVATRFFEVDRARSWETMADAVKAANGAAGFTGEEGGVGTYLQTGGAVAVINTEAPSFDLEGIFGLLAEDDMYRAITLAKSLTGEVPRAGATIAVARSALDKGRASLPAAPK